MTGSVMNCDVAGGRGRRALTALGAALAQETLDSLIRSSPDGSRCSSTSIEPLDVRPHRLLHRGRGVESRPQLAGLLVEIASWQVDPQVAPQGWAPGHRGRRIWPRDVVRDLGEVAHGGDTASAIAISSTPTRRRPGRAAVRRAGMTSSRRRPGSEVVPRIGRRACGTAAGIEARLIHSTTPRRRASRRWAANAAIGRRLRPRHDEHRVAGPDRRT